MFDEITTVNIIIESKKISNPDIKPYTLSLEDTIIIIYDGRGRGSEHKHQKITDIFFINVSLVLLGTTYYIGEISAQAWSNYEGEKNYKIFNLKLIKKNCN